MRTYGEKKDYMLTVRAPKKLVQDVRATGINIQNEIRKLMQKIVRKHKAAQDDRV